MELLVIADPHYSRQPDCAALYGRRGDLTLPLLEEIYRRERDIDAVALLGDVSERGEHPDLRAELTAVRDALLRYGRPIIALSGNHDPDIALLEEVFGPAAPQVIGGVRLIPFSDPRDEEGFSWREFDVMERAFAEIKPGERVVVLQHNPVLPKFGSSPVRYLEIADAYSQASVALSISGHIHDGFAPISEGNVVYFGAPGLCAPPYRYARVTVTQDAVRVDVREVGECAVL